MCGEGPGKPTGQNCCVAKERALPVQNKKYDAKKAMWGPVGPSGRAVAGRQLAHSVHFSLFVELRNCFGSFTCLIREGGAGTATCLVTCRRRRPAPTQRAAAFLQQAAGMAVQLPPLHQDPCIPDAGGRCALLAAATACVRLVTAACSCAGRPHMLLLPPSHERHAAGRWACRAKNQPQQHTITAARPSRRPHAPIGACDVPLG